MVRNPLAVKAVPQAGRPWLPVKMNIPDKLLDQEWISPEPVVWNRVCTISHAKLDCGLSEILESSVLRNGKGSTASWSVRIVGSCLLSGAKNIGKGSSKCVLSHRMTSTLVEMQQSTRRTIRCQNKRQSIITRQQSITNTRHDTTRKPLSTTKQANTRWQQIMRTSPKVTTNTQSTTLRKRSRPISSITARPCWPAPSFLRAEPSLRLISSPPFVAFREIGRNCRHSANCLGFS